MTASLDPKQTVEMLRNVCDAVIAGTDRLTAADKEIGDGDHGVGMERGFKAARAKLDETEFAEVGAPFKAVGMAVMSQTGGAAGAIFGTLYRAMGRGLDDRNSLDGAGFAQALSEACEQVKKRGGAKVGDKTVVDALEPAADAARSSGTEDLSKAVKAATAAAEQGLEDTKKLVAAQGKARSLGERGVGHIDPGALSLTIMLDAMRIFLR